jgi:hypothetical protein
MMVFSSNHPAQHIGLGELPKATKSQDCGETQLPELFALAKPWT